MSGDRVIVADYHRNGVGGAGFGVAIVETDGASGLDAGRYLVVDFAPGTDSPDEFREAYAVLRVDDVKAGNIAMHPLTDPDSGVVIEGTGGAAWRGHDYWAPIFRPLAEDWRERSHEQAMARFRAEHKLPVRVC